MAKELLTDVTVRNAKPIDKDLRLNDGSGLYLLLKSNGAKWDSPCKPMQVIFFNGLAVSERKERICERF